MKSLKLIGSLFIWGAITTFMSCSNDGENLSMYSDEEFHDKIVQIQNKYNSSLKINEACLRKDDETLTNINDIMRTIENSSFCYELITSEEGGLIAMPILNTTATRSNSSELEAIYSVLLSHGELPCFIEVSGKGAYFQIKSVEIDFEIENISCTGNVTKESVSFSGDIRINRGTGSYATYYLFCKKDWQDNIFEVFRKY